MKKKKVIHFVKCMHVCRVTKIQHGVFDYKTNFYKEIKRQMSILSKRANANARHAIDSKLKTMRITENLAGRGGRGGDCLILYFQ